MEMLCDSNIRVCLFTVIVLVIVLGIDTMIFIAILVEKLPRNSATRHASLTCRSP